MTRYKFDPVKSLQNQDSALVEANERAARGLGLPDISTLPLPKVPCLAIVGGGPSIKLRRNALRRWDGSVWAINHAALWCERNGIACTLFTVDADPGIDPAIEGTVKRAILSMRVHQGTFRLLRNAHVVTFDLPLKELGPGSAGSACLLATRFCGFTDITFFGCEGSTPAPGQSHAYAQDDYVADKLILVECAGQRFLTHPGHLLTTRAIAFTIRQTPTKVRERCGGLLSAMVRSFDFDVIGVSPALATPSTAPELVKEYLAFTRQT